MDATVAIAAMVAGDRSALSDILLASVEPSSMIEVRDYLSVIQVFVHIPSRQPTQHQHRRNKTCGLPKGQSEQILDAQEKTGCQHLRNADCVRLPLVAANHAMLLCTQIVSEPRALNAALYCFQLVVR